MSDLIKPPTQIRTWEIIAPVTHGMPGTLKDWPQNIQDQVFAALEAKAKQVELPLTIIFSGSYVDERGAYVRIIASEIVVADHGPLMRGDIRMTKQ